MGQKPPLRHMSLHASPREMGHRRGCIPPPQWPIGTGDEAREFRAGASSQLFAIIGAHDDAYWFMAEVPHLLAS